MLKIIVSRDVTLDEQGMPLKSASTSSEGQQLGTRVEVETPTIKNHNIVDEDEGSHVSDSKLEETLQQSY